MGKVFAAMMLPVYAWFFVIIFDKLFGFPIANSIYTLGMLPFEIMFQSLGVNIFQSKLDFLISIAAVLIWIYIAKILDRK